MSKQKSLARHKARELALQAIYQWQYTQASATDIELEFHEDNDMSQIDAAYFSELLHKVPNLVQEIDGHLTKVIDRPFTDLNPVEVAILRIAVYEMLYRQDVPYKVIINEALQIAKRFGAQDGFKYVNGVLDAVSKDIRGLEVSLHQAKKAKLDKEGSE